MSERHRTNKPITAFCPRCVEPCTEFIPVRAFKKHSIMTMKCECGCEFRVRVSDFVKGSESHD